MLFATWAFFPDFLLILYFILKALFTQGVFICAPCKGCLYLYSNAQVLCASPCRQSYSCQFGHKGCMDTATTQCDIHADAWPRMHPAFRAMHPHECHTGSRGCVCAAFVSPSTVWGHKQHMFNLPRASKHDSSQGMIWNAPCEQGQNWTF